MTNENEKLLFILGLFLLLGLLLILVLLTGNELEKLAHCFSEVLRDLL